MTEESQTEVICQSRRNNGANCTEKPKIQVRLAREEDFQDVQRISEGVYNGNDYLSKSFHEYLKIPRKLIFLAELNGKVIGLRVVNVVSGGNTFFMSGLRIDKDHRGKGLSRLVVSGVVNAARQLYPGAAKMQWVLFEGFSAPQAFSLLRGYGGDNPIDERHVVQFSIKRTIVLLARHMTPTNHISLHQYKVEDAETMFAAVLAIAQKKAIFRPGSAYDPLPSNICHIFKENDKMFAEVSKEELEEGEAVIRSFSQGTMSKRKLFVLYACMIYANDRELFRAHFIKQLQIAMEIEADVFRIQVYICSKSPSFEGEAKKIIKEELKGFDLSDSIAEHSMYLYEFIFSENIPAVEESVGNTN